MCVIYLYIHTYICTYIHSYVTIENFILDVIKYCDHPRWYEKIPPGGGTSNWRWHLWSEVTPQSEVGPPIGGGLCMWGHTGAPMLHVGISYSFEKKKRLFIVDYIKPSPVYQVKCKLVINWVYYMSKFGCCIWSISTKRLNIFSKFPEVPQIMVNNV